MVDRRLIMTAEAFMNQHVRLREHAAGRVQDMVVTIRTGVSEARHWVCFWVWSDRIGKNTP